MSAPEDLSPEQINPIAPSFMRHYNDWRTGRLALAEILRLPRQPEIIGTVPNPEEFSQPNGLVSYRGSLERDRLLHPKALGAQPMPVPNQFAATLEVILADAAQRADLSIDNSEVRVSIRQRPMQEHVGRNAHLDKGFQLIYLVSDYLPTEFLVGSFQPPDTLGGYYWTSALSQAERSSPAPKPYDITVFDETIPHIVPPGTDDPTMRTLLRVAFV